ncbi:MAG TPA: hypothetical protein ENN05_09235 [Deltaproteobacteria bacterium]|nr:hypothetical protein [Deltaproteobacteria bacterium]
MDTDRMTKIFETALIIFFLAAIFAPPAGTLFLPGNKVSEAEKRELAPAPGAPENLRSLLDFPQEFEAYYNDHFGFRDFFVMRYQREMRHWFRKSGSKHAVQGRDGWFFFVGDYLLEDYRGLVPLSDEHIAEWLKEQDRKEEWLRTRGIRYLLFVVPNKQSIYPEYLPHYIQAARGITRFEQLLDHIDHELPPYMLNIHPVLRDAKAGQTFPLYYKADTHWNLLGAYLAFGHVMERLATWYPQEKFRTEFSFTEAMQEKTGSDLATLLMIRDKVTEKNLRLKRESVCAADLPVDLELSNLPPQEGRAPFMKGCPDAGLKAVVFRDSFFTALEPFFSENFRQVLYIWKQYDQRNMEDLIESFQPDIVIEERVERFFHLSSSIYRIQAEMNDPTAENDIVKQ